MSVVSPKFYPLMSSLQHYFRSNPSSLRIFVEIVSNRSTVVSLRLLDWLVTNFVTAHAIPDESPEGRMKRKDLYYEYSNHLDTYTKVWFDPFARKSADKGSFKIQFDTHTCDFSIVDDSFESPSEQIIVTTAGQLNFFRVAIQSNFIQYAFDHHERIQAHMVNGLASRKRTKIQSTSETFYKPCSEFFQAVPLDPHSAFAHDPSIRVTVQRPPA